MSVAILTRTTAALMGAAMLTACAGLNFNSGAEKKAEEAADKAGRIAMVLGDEKLEADPALVSTTITLPAATDVKSWPQAGQTASKVIGHVRAAEQMQVAWKVNAGRGSDNRSALTTPPVASETTIYVLDSAQTVRAYDIATGGLYWKNELKSGNRRDKVAIGGGLAVEGNILVVASAFGFVSTHDAQTGVQLWKRDLAAPMTGAPTVKDGRIFVSSNNNEIYALDLTTGETIWSDQAIAEPARVLGSSSPAAVEDILVAPFSSGEVIAYRASNGRRLWSDALARSGRFTPISAINDIASRPVLSGGLVFAANQSGILAAIDGRSGNRAWAQPVGSTQAPVLAGSTLFVSGTDGKLVALDAATGGVYWAAELPRFENEKKKKGRIAYAGPVVASDRILLVSSTGMLSSYSPQTGELLGEIKIGGPVFIEPIVVQGKLIILTDDAKLVAVQ